MTEVSTLSLRATGSWYQSDDDVVGDSSAYGLDVEWFTRQSEQVAWFLRGGADITTTEDAVGNELLSDEASFAGGAGVRWKGEVTGVLFDIESGVAPVWSGGVVQRDQLRFRFDYRLSPTFTVLAEIRGLRNRNLDSDSEDPEETYSTGSLGFEWRFRSAWAVRAQYEYGNRDSDLFTDDAESNAFRVGVVYEPRRDDQITR